MQIFELGELVTLNNHPFFYNNTEILISADETLIPPVMVIIEILLDYRTKFEYEEKTGLIDSNQSQLKCIFYSHKTGKYETNWFIVSQLKRISIDIEEAKIEISDIRNINKILNKNVILKTWSIEIIKKKSSLNYNSNSNEKSNKISSLLSFLPPIMTVIGIKKIDDIKENNFDKKTGNPKRLFSKFLIKCKWFNPLTCSFSEDYFTPETLNIVKQIDNNLIVKIERLIKDKKFVQFKNQNIKYNNGITVGKPLNITFNHCYYKLNYFDYITNSIETINLNDFLIDDFIEKNSYANKFVPEYNEFEIKEDIEQFLINEFQLQEEISSKIYRIKYLNINDIDSTRTILNANLFYNGYRNDFSDGIDKYEKKYIDAECCSRDGQKRYFKFNRIKKIEILDINNELDNTSNLIEIDTKTEFIKEVN